MRDHDPEHPVRVLPDGRRKYVKGYKYTPVPPEKRKYKDHSEEKGQYWGKGHHWFPDLPLLSDEDRVMPETLTDYMAYLHDYGCRCTVCRRSTSLWWKRKKTPGVILSEEDLTVRAAHGLRSMPLRAVETKG